MVEEEKYIKIPKDFTDLTDLKDLMSNYEFAAKLTNALNGYQAAYVNSHLMTMDEVLEYIPVEHHNTYSVCARNQEAYAIDYPRATQKNPHPSGKYVTDLGRLLKTLKADKNARVFLVNVIDKKVDVCLWILRPKSKDPTYKNQPEFIVDVDTRELSMHVPYSYTTQQAVGGAWINGRKRGYLSGHTYSDYTINGYDIYKFCTRRNKYLGYFGHKEDPRRDWVDTSNRY